jgi:SAM-dependent methyltransferase
MKQFFARKNPASRRNGMREFLDAPGIPLPSLSHNLQEIRRINRGLGWTGAMLRLIDRVVTEAGVQQFSYLDVATGSGDLPRALLAHARRRHWVIDAAGLDWSPDVLAVAREYLGDLPVALHVGDARALPFPDHSIDVVTCVLSLHHFAPDDAVQVLREVARVARRAWLVVDVERGPLPYLGALAMRILLRSPLTRHDAPATVLRAYTLPELKALLARADLGQARVSVQLPFRLVAYDILDVRGRPDFTVGETAVRARDHDRGQIGGNATMGAAVDKIGHLVRAVTGLKHGGGRKARAPRMYRVTGAADPGADGEVPAALQAQSRAARERDFQPRSVPAVGRTLPGAG